MGTLGKIVIGVFLLTGGLPLMMIMTRMGTPGHVSPHTQMTRVVSCANQGAKAEAFCSDPELKALNEEINAAYARARDRFSEAAQSYDYLAETHEKYLSGRDFFPQMTSFIHEVEHLRTDEGARENGLDVRDMLNQREVAVRMLNAMRTPERRMRRYLTFLESLDAPRTGLEGRWVSLGGELLIKRSGARVIIHETGADLRRCILRVRASIVNDVASVADAPPSTWSEIMSSSSDTLGGWSLRTRRQGALLKVTERTDKDRAPKENQLRPYCGGSAPMEGLYFPAR